MDDNDIVNVGLMKQLSDIIKRDVNSVRYILYGFIGFQLAFDVFLYIKMLGVI